MTRWADALDRPTLIVGDFNVAPLECDVYDHKALLKVVSHTPVEVESARPVPRRARLGRPRPRATSRRRSATTRGGATAPSGGRRTRAGGSTTCGPRPSWRAQARGAPRRRGDARLGAAVATMCRWSRSSISERAVARRAARRRRSTRCGTAGRSRSTAAPALLPAETGFGAGRGRAAHADLARRARRRSSSPTSARRPMPARAGADPRRPSRSTSPLARAAGRPGARPCAIR